MENNNNFLPEGYEVPTSGGAYMKLKQGDNLFRILTKPIMGYLGWNLENKPERRKKKEEFAGVQLQENKSPRHFWAFGVYNFTTKQVEVMEITQATIQTQLTAIFNNPSWGAPFGYNLTINRAGDGLDTTYTTQPIPPDELTNEVKQKVIESPLNLDALYSGNDPFAVDKPEYTQEQEDQMQGEQHEQQVKEKVESDDLPF